MASVNLVILMGHLGADPDLKYTEAGKAFCSLSLATSDEWTDKDGKKQKKTEWHRIKVWGKPAENCKKYLSSGSSVYIEGRISTSKWKDQDQKDHYATEIIADKISFLSSPQPKPQLPPHMRDDADEPSFRHRSI